MAGGTAGRIESMTDAWADEVLRLLREISTKLDMLLKFAANAEEGPLKPRKVERAMLRPTEVAVALGISRAAAYQMITSGQLPSVRFGRSVRVPSEAVDNLKNVRQK